MWLDIAIEEETAMLKDTNNTFNLFFIYLNIFSNIHFGEQRAISINLTGSKERVFKSLLRSQY